MKQQLMEQLIKFTLNIRAGLLRGKKSSLKSHQDDFRTWGNYPLEVLNKIKSYKPKPR